MIYEYVICAIPPGNNKFLGRDGRCGCARPKKEWERAEKNASGTEE